MRWALVFLVACGSPLSFAIAREFPPADSVEIRAAAGEWNKHLRNPITFDGTSWRVVREAPAGGWNGFCDVQRRLIQIHPEHPGATVYAVALHEFGHAIGLRHVCWSAKASGASTGPECIPGRSRGVMDPINVTSELSDADLEECIHAGACK